MGAENPSSYTVVNAPPRRVWTPEERQYIVTVLRQLEGLKRQIQKLLDS